MKYLKVLAVAIIATFAFEGAQAQVVVNARIGAPAHRVYRQRTVVVNRPAYRPAYRRTVVVNRPVYRRTVVRPVYRRTYVRPAYHRAYARRVVVRHY
ncbi:hypothetical protein [Mucilaginibacter sp.]|uniref:hypothetical protein n=1 Tax=Mucilaginibacter sp. TaxID=1882438 RepID=UPI0035BBE826